MQRYSSKPLLWAFLILLFNSVPAYIHADDPENDITEHYRRMMKYHIYMDGNIPDGSVLFIGDSITQGLCVTAVCAHAVNYGIGSDTTFGVIKRLPSYASMNKAGAVVLAIGVNDLGKRDNPAILDNYKQIIAATPSHTPLLFSAVLPLDERVKDMEAGRNMRIRELNKGLAAICEENSRCSFMDSTASLLDETGNLNPAYHVGDGVHLSTAGYAIWIRDLREKLDAIGFQAHKIKCGLNIP